MCVFGLGFRLRPASPGWGVGLCVCSCARSACTQPLLARVRSVGVCVWARVSAAPRHSWLGWWAACDRVRAPLAPSHSWHRCAVWVSVFGLWFRLRPATPGWVLGCGWAGVRAPLAPSHSWLGCAVWVCVFGLGFLAAPRHSWLGCWGVRVCVRAPLASSHSWHGCAVWVCVFWLGFWLRPATPGWGVHCGCVCSGSGFGCAPPLLAGVCGVWVGCCLAPVLVLLFVAYCARSPFLWHPAAVAAWHLSVCLGCGRRRASLACLVAPCGAPRLVRSGRSGCSGRLSRRRRAFPHPGGLCPRLYWALCACRWPPPRRGRWARSASYPFGAPRWSCPWRVPPALVLGCVRCGGWRVLTRSLTRPVARTVRRSTGDSAGAPGLFRVDADTAPFGSGDAKLGFRACVCACSSWPGRAGRPPGRVLVELTFSLGRFGFLLCLAAPFLVFFFSCPHPLCLLLSLVSGPGCLGPWRCALRFFSPPASRLSVRSRFFFFFFLLGRLLHLGAWCPPPLPLCLAGFVAAARCPPPFFFLPLPPLSLAFSGFRPRVPWALALCFVCFVGRAFSPLFSPPSGRLAAPRWLLPPPPFCVSQFSSLPHSAVCRVLCCAVCPGLRCCAALLRVVSPGVVLLCAVLFCCARFVPLLVEPCPLVLPVTLGPCAFLPGALCFAALCFAVFPRAVCVLSLRGGVCCCSPLCFVLCVSWGAVLCVPCPLRSVRCCASLCWCACVVLFVWCVLLLAPGAVVRCRVLCCFLWCAVVPCWVWWPVVVRWCRAVAPCCPFSFAGGVGLSLFPVCAVLCCAARRLVRFRLRLRCFWCLVLWRVPVCCGLSLGVLRCGGAPLVCRGVLLCCALSCGVLRPVLCPAVLCCLAVLCWWAVLCGCLRCWCLFFLLSSFPLLNSLAVFPCL